MSIWQLAIESLQSIVANKLRSGLTILGIVIGVGAVVAMMGVGTGAQSAITGQITSTGANLIFVMPGNQQEEVRNAKDLSTEDVDALNDPFQAPSVELAAPVVGGSVEISYGGESTTTSASGITPEYMTARDYELSEGEFINETHILGRSSVAIIGSDVAEKLFDRTDNVVGETVRIEGQPFRVIGLLTTMGGGMAGSQDNVALVPFTTAQTRLLRRSQNSVDSVLVQAIDSDHVDQAAEEVRQILRSRHRITIGSDDFTIMSQKDIVDMVSQITGIFTIFLGGVAGISLLVGGIGIMNIMLVSVTERTREIGLRKALGARKMDVMLQFMTESLLLSLLGGALGIALGYLLSFIIGYVASATGTPFQPQVGLDSILLATVFSTGVGLFFGLYPANRAASLQPVEALRYQ